MRRMLFLGVVAVAAWSLSCATVWADTPSSGAQGAMRAPNAAMTVNRPTDYSDGIRRQYGNFNPGLVARQQMVFCRVRSSLGMDSSRPVEIVYVAQMGSACGIPPFYGFGFSVPVNR
jgi:hypothetical protein